MASFKLRVIGEDPSMSNWGLCVADIIIDPENQTAEVKIIDLILVETESSKDVKKSVRRNSDDIDRAQALLEGRNEAYRRYNPEISFAEVPVGSQNARAMCSYGMCVAILATRGEPVVQLKPDEVKMAAVGHKKASKEEMIEWAVAKHPDAPWKINKGKPVLKNEHLADAIATIYAGLKNDQFKVYMRGAISSWRARQPGFTL